MVMKSIPQKFLQFGKSIKEEKGEDGSDERKNMPNVEIGTLDDLMVHHRKSSIHDVRTSSPLVRNTARYQR